jgi:hypothetical protein
MLSKVPAEVNFVIIVTSFEGSLKVTIRE